MKMKRFSIVGVLLAVLLIAAPVFAAEILWLDTHEDADDGAAGPVWTTGVLQPGVTYWITIGGTYSIWSPADWVTAYPDHPANCGAPVSAPMFSSTSTGALSGMVGADAEYWFAAPGREWACWHDSNTWPLHISNIRFNLDGNPDNWVGLEPKDAGYKADHTYVYQVVGRGTPAKIGFAVSDLTSDNYGMLRIVVESLPTPPLEVAIDIKPGSDPNSVNLNDHGVIPVAILGSATFDVSLVNPGTVTLEGMAVKHGGKSNPALAHVQDVNGDGFIDMVVQIADGTNTLAAGSTVANLAGLLLDGTPIRGSDSMNIVP